MFHSSLVCLYCVVSFTCGADRPDSFWGDVGLSNFGVELGQNKTHPVLHHPVQMHLFIRLQ